jgi:hypothetical protein
LPENQLLADPDRSSAGTTEALIFIRESIPQQSCSDDHGEQWPECYEHLEETLRNPVMIKRSRQHDKV